MHVDARPVTDMGVPISQIDRRTSTANRPRTDMEPTRFPPDFRASRISPTDRSVWTYNADDNCNRQSAAAYSYYC